MQRKNIGPGLLRRIERDLEPVPRERMVEKAMNRCVAYERDESGWWVASVRGVRGCHTQGRTVDEARRRIVEALGLFVDNAHKATIVDEVGLPKSAARTVRLRHTSQEGRSGRSTCSSGSPTGRTSATSR
jgi:predicted RNase H-like HicB family nuclease